MFAKSSNLSCAAPVFTPQGASMGYLQQYSSNRMNEYMDYSYGYESHYPQKYMSSKAMPFTPQSKQVAVNLDDFSDLSDSDDEDMKLKELELPQDPKVLEEKEPAEEPSPCATSETTFEDLREVRTDSVLSSSSSEPDHEQLDAEPVYDIRQLLNARKALSNEPQIVLYRTVAVQPEKIEEKEQKEPKEIRRKPKLESSETSWLVQQRRAKSETETKEHVARTIKSILNKLTLEKFTSLSQQLLECGISTSEHLVVLIHEVFEKATTQHHFIDMYADLCVLLHEHFTAKPLDDKKVTFKRLLLDECQSSFERLLTPPALEQLPEAERVIAEVSYKTHMLGNIKLVGGLLARGMLAAKVGMAVLEELMSNPTPEALESVAALLTVMGSTADRPEWGQKLALNRIFDEISEIVTAKRCQPRERCLLKDLLELRRNGWVDRRPKKLERAMTLAEVAEGATGERNMRKVIHFDQEKFRRGALALLRGDDGDDEACGAWPQLRAAGRPPASKQPLELAELLSTVVQEKASLRTRGFEALLSIAGEWHVEALAQGVKLFVTDVALDLSLDVPNLPAILEEFHGMLRAGGISPASQQALKAFQAP